VRYSFRQK